jgi:hypothetical protein
VTAHGCAAPPQSSQYAIVSGTSHTRFDLHVGTGGCAAGAEITVTEAVTGPAKSAMIQTVSVPGRDSAKVSFVLP